MISPLQISKTQAGFTLVELLMVIAILGVLTVMSLVPISNTIEEGRFQETLQKMQTIRNSIVGDPAIVENGIRTSFGFIGDIGAIPTAGQGIAALVTKPVALPAWSVDSTVRFGLGWNGPYLTSATAGTDFTLDAWGRPFVYSPASSPPTLVSYGADGIAGGTGFDSDITVELPVALQTSTVYGFISNSAKPFIGDAVVEINYPDGAGVLKTDTATVVPVDKGKFSFPGIPLGKRSVTVYIPSKIAPTQTLGPALITVDNSHFVIPNTALDTNSSGGAQCNNLGVVTLAGAISLTNANKTLNFQINISTNIELQQMSVSDSTATTWNATSVDVNVFGCSGADSLYTCPTADDGTLSSLTPAIVINSGTNIPVIMTFASSIAGSGTAVVQFNYNLGCDRVSVTGL
jgi:general secretion pathway protein G